MMNWTDMTEALAELEAANLRRNPITLDSPAGPTVRINGRDVMCLCSNDYLGLANDPAVKAAAVSAIERWGVGSGASRLICGSQSPHRELEAALAAFKHAEDALLTSTGFMANLAAVVGLAGKGDLILADKLNHASLIDAARATEARLKTYPHGDMARLKKMLDAQRNDYRRCLILTDSLFSMDGDIAPLAELCDLKERYDARLLIDEAHATGVFGDTGSGLAEHLGVTDRIDVAVGTLSKAVGGLGGFITGPTAFIDVLRSTARPYIYTTAPPPALAAAARESLRIIQRESQRRIRLVETTAWLREELTQRGLDTLNSESQIIPVLIGPAEKALSIAAQLLEAGFLIPAIRPPTVPPNTSRLRISLSSAHRREDIAPLPDLLERLCRS